MMLLMLRGLAGLAVVATTANAQQASPGTPVPVTVDNFIRAESDLHMSNVVREGALGTFTHQREPAAIDQQTVIRPNRDTLHSSAVVDLDVGPVTVTLPDAGRRFMSMQVINQDHDAVGKVVYHPGTYSYDRKRAGTRYALIALRTLVDSSNPKDLQQVHALQDAVKLRQNGRGWFEVPNWDQASQKTVRDALLALGSTIPDLKTMFGARGHVDRVRHLIGMAVVGWAGSSDQDVIDLNVTPKNSDDQALYRLKVGNVPVDGFWSVSVYNAEGYFQPNAQNAYSRNSIMARKDIDGAVVIQFGGCDGKRPNCLPIVKGWTYTVRLYRPHPQVLDGTWKFPRPQPLNLTTVGRRGG